MRSVAFLVIAACAGVLGLLVAAPAADTAYQKRFNRYEGLLALKHAGAPEPRLVSFIAYREKLRIRNRPVLKVRFFLPKTRPVFITAVELRRQSHYQMRPLDPNGWYAGWQEFSPWPTGDVLADLPSFELDNLGVVARLDSYEETGSGPVAPVIVYAGSYATDRAEYTVHLLPPDTLAKAEYRVDSIAAHKMVAYGKLCEDRPGHSQPCIPGNIPFAITFDLSGCPSGRYRLLTVTRIYGQANEVSQQFSFWHEGQR